MKTHKLNKTSDNNRLAEMGFVKGTIFRIVKKVAGMIQIRIPHSDIVIREELFGDMDYDDKR